MISPVTWMTIPPPMAIHANTLELKSMPRERSEYREAEQSATSSSWISSRARSQPIWLDMAALERSNVPWTLDFVGAGEQSFTRRLEPGPRSPAQCVSASRSPALASPRRQAVARRHALLSKKKKKKKKKRSTGMHSVHKNHECINRSTLGKTRQQS